jgi:DnaJ like chaperone protein
MYGEERASHAFKLFNGIIKKKDISTRQVCMQIRQNMEHASRLQLIHFLFGIAKSDAHVSKSEVEMIQKIAGYLYINNRDFESIKAMFYSSTNNAYKILEIDEKFRQIQKAYEDIQKERRM